MTETLENYSGYTKEVIKGHCPLCKMNSLEHDVYHGNGGLEAHEHWTISGIRYRMFVNGVEVNA